MCFAPQNQTSTCEDKVRLFYAIKKIIAITHLCHGMGPQTMYHLIAKDKVAEQYIWRKSCNCNSFLVMSPLLKVARIAITYFSLGLSP